MLRKRVAAGRTISWNGFILLALLNTHNLLHGALLITNRFEASHLLSHDKSRADSSQGGRRADLASVANRASGTQPGKGIILRYLPDVKPSSLEKILQATFSHLRFDRSRHYNETSLRFQLHRGTLESFLYILTSEFPKPGMYSFDALYAVHCTAGCYGIGSGSGSSCITCRILAS